jgi:ferredoxin-NADP reductase
MPALLVSHHRPGFYMRVITEGHIQGGDAIIKTRTGPGALSVADTDALLYLPDPDRVKLRAALEIPALSPGWQGSFRDLLAPAKGESATSPFGAGTSPAPKPAWTAFRPLRVAKIVPESENVSSIYLADPGGTALPTARPGQYLTLRVSGAADPPPVRSYSLSWTAGAGTYRISVKREPHGTVSGYLDRSLQPGAVLDVAAPRGDFVLADGTGPILLISAGIGVTPVLCMLYQLANEKSEREVWWLYGARGPREHPFAAEAHTLLTSLPHAREHVFYSAATPAERAGAHAADGRLTKEALLGLAVPPDAAAYVCGPSSFMADMQEALTTAGLASAAIRTELFGALPSVTPGISGQASQPPHQPPGPPGAGPRVTFARSGLTVPFGDDWGNVLDLADACDVPTRWSCRTGVCHTCITTLVSGDITYNPDPLEPPPDGNVLICCARPTTDIVVDL